MYSIYALFIANCVNVHGVSIAVHVTYIYTIGLSLCTFLLSIALCSHYMSVSLLCVGPQYEGVALVHSAE